MVETETKEDTSRKRKTKSVHAFSFRMQNSLESSGPSGPAPSRTQGARWKTCAAAPPPWLVQNAMSASHALTQEAQHAIHRVLFIVHDVKCELPEGGVVEQNLC